MRAIPFLVAASAVACGGASGGPPVFNEGDAGGDATGSGVGAPLEAGGRVDATEAAAPDVANDQASEAAEADSAGPNCGNGVLDPGEQCDDGNRFNLDGCDSSCRYELVTRMTLLSFESTPAPAFCTPATNLFGTQSVTSAGLAQLNPNLQSDVANGNTNTFVQFLGLADLTGAGSASQVSLGLLSGQVDTARGTWPGNSPIDWWFLADHATVAPTGLAASLFSNATLTGGTLTAGPSDIDMPLPLGGSAALLHVRGAHVSATINAMPPPDAPPPPPDKLSPGLTVFQTITADGIGQGLCGNMTVESLANTPVLARPDHGQHGMLCAVRWFPRVCRLRCGQSCRAGLQLVARRARRRLFRLVTLRLRRRIAPARCGGGDVGAAAHARHRKQGSVRADDR